MNILIRRFSLIMIIVLVFSMLTGCAPENKIPVGEEKLLQNFGFSSVKSAKEGKDFIEINTNGNNLKLEVQDKTIYDSLVESEFYIFTYNEKNILKSIRTDELLKKLIENSMQEEPKPDKDMETKEISPVDKVSLENLTLLDEYIFDFNGDNIDDKISMYVAAERDNKGEIMWDDGQRWLFVVHGKDKDYILFDDYIQLGSMTSYVYTIDEDFYIASITTGTANLNLKSYLYQTGRDVFIETTQFGTEGNVNMLHRSQF